jgi:hypothetical protein
MLAKGVAGPFLTIGGIFKCQLNDGMLDFLTYPISNIGFAMTFFLERFNAAFVVSFFSSDRTYRGYIPLHGTLRIHFADAKLIAAIQVYF